MLAFSALLLALAASEPGPKSEPCQEPAPAAKSVADNHPRWKELAARCGEELAWAKDWDEAAARAKAEKKPVLAVAWLYSGFDIADASRCVFGMDPDVIELVNARYVPLVLAHETQVPFGAQSSYGLSPTAFGSALLVVSPAGEVLADSPHWQPPASYDFLCSALEDLKQFPAETRPRKQSDEERVAWHLARGELGDALACAQDLESARAWFLKAVLLRRGHQPDAALAAIAHAGELVAGKSEPEVAPTELDREELQSQLVLGHVAAARTLCERLVATGGTRPEALEAAYLLGVLDFFAGNRAGCEGRWNKLTLEHPESRWAWKAAAALLAPEVVLGPFMLDRATPEVRASIARVPLATRAEDAPLDPALAWLVERRRSDGSWPDSSEVEAGASPVNAISVAVDVLATRALLAHRARKAVDLAHETRLALDAARASLARRSTEPTYMTYEVWSDAMALELLADLLEAGADHADELRALGTELARALASHQRTNGGWSYFQAVSLDASAAKLEQSISFVTASVVLALLRAHEAGVELDLDELERGVDALEAMRSDEGVFAYMLWSYEKHAKDEEHVGGAAGRAPLCELALLRAGRSDEARLRAALDQFFEHAATLAKEAGKALMHCGAEGQGCHYVLYDYAATARAIAALPAAERKPYRARLLALVAATRRTDGAYLDTPILGPAFGTAMALLAHAELARD